MAKKISPVTPVAKTAARPAEKIVEKAVSTPVRNTPIPKVASIAPKQLSHESIAKRAYEISISGNGGSETDNWFRAERELRGL